jgi:hypothetical protein
VWCSRSSCDAHQVCWPVLQAWFINASVLPSTSTTALTIIQTILTGDTQQLWALWFVGPFRPDQMNRV